MSRKSTLPWDLEQAMTAFQVKQTWYEDHWLCDKSDLAGARVHRRPNGSIDIDFYRSCAKRERDRAIKQACFKILEILVRVPRLAMRCSHIIRKP
jgi:hypothetical protein